MVLTALRHFVKAERIADQDARQPREAESIHLVRQRDRERSDRVLAELYESADVVLPSDLADDPPELPEPTPDTRWLMYGDQALAAAQEEQAHIKAKIKPHVERYRKLTGNKC